MTGRLGANYRRWMLYGVFGAGTTLLNIVSYLLCYQALGMANVPSNLIAWIVAVTFAFLTNKIWVFDSRAFALRLVVAEAIRFYGGRLATGALDLVIMYIGVDILAGPATALKVVSDAIVIVVNYLVSRYWVFCKKEESRGLLGKK